MITKNTRELRCLYASPFLFLQEEEGRCKRLYKQRAWRRFSSLEPTSTVTSGHRLPSPEHLLTQSVGNCRLSYVPPRRPSPVIQSQHSDEAGSPPYLVLGYPHMDQQAEVPWEHTSTAEVPHGSRPSAVGALRSLGQLYTLRLGFDSLSRGNS